MAYSGFPRSTLYTPVPDPLLGTLLASINDLLELKCVLRAIWLLHHQKGHPPTLSLEQLGADGVLRSAIPADCASPQDAVKDAMARATTKGIFLAVPASSGELRYALNTEANQQLMALGAITSNAGMAPAPGLAIGQGPSNRPNVFALYEENVGMLTPLVADELKDAEERYPATWIEEAIRLAVTRNRRHWRYIAGILERWATEGKDDGELGRHPQKNSHQRRVEEYLRRRSPAP